MNTTNIDKAIERIRSISWESDFSRQKSQTALLHEHWRRMVKWTEFLNCREQWLFGDLASCIDSNLEIDESKIQKLKQDLELLRMYLHPFIRRVCINFVRWETLKEGSSLVEQSNLPDPYEPIILMFERGGIFYTESGYFDLSGAGIPRPTWEGIHDNILEIKITPEELDNFDAKSNKGLN